MERLCARPGTLIGRHPATELRPAGAVCLHRCNAGRCRVAHDSASRMRRGAQVRCALQRSRARGRGGRRCAAGAPPVRRRCAAGALRSHSASAPPPGSRHGVRSQRVVRRVPSASGHDTPLSSAERPRPVGRKRPDRRPVTTRRATHGVSRPVGRLTPRPPRPPRPSRPAHPTRGALRSRSVSAPPHGSGHEVRSQRRGRPSVEREWSRHPAQLRRAATSRRPSTPRPTPRDHSAPDPRRVPPGREAHTTPRTPVAPGTPRSVRAEIALRVGSAARVATRSAISATGSPVAFRARVVTTPRSAPPSGHVPSAARAPTDAS